MATFTVPDPSRPGVTFKLRTSSWRRYLVIDLRDRTIVSRSSSLATAHRLQRNSTRARVILDQELGGLVDGLGRALAGRAS